MDSSGRALVAIARCRARGAIDRLRQASVRARRPGARRLCRPAPLVDRGSRRLLEPGLGVLRRHRRARRPGAGRRRQDARRGILPRCEAEFRREPAAGNPARRTRSSFAARTRSSGASRWDELRALVSQLQQAMRALGVKPGDRVAAMLPNMPEAIAGMLAAASLGAIWSSCSPDFGVEGVLDRFGQIEPVAVHRLRRLLVQRQAERRVGQGAGGAGAAAERPRRRLIVDYLRTAATGGDRHAAARSPSTQAHRAFPAAGARRSSGWRSRIRSTSCSRRARPASRNASSIRPAAR